MTPWPALVFLAVSLVSLSVQGVSLVRLLRRGAVAGLAYRGLLRTSGCRAAAAASYVAFGVVALAVPALAASLALVIFTAVQVLWMSNSVLDVRLRGRLATEEGTAPPNPHRLRQPAPTLRSVAFALAVLVAFGLLLWRSQGQQAAIDDFTSHVAPALDGKPGKPVAGWTFTTVAGTAYDCKRDAASPDDAATYTCTKRTEASQ